MTELDRRMVSEVIPYASNSRTHSEEQVTAIAASIKEFGFTNPVLIDEGNGIIAGHGRVLAAKKLGLTEVPVIVLSHLTEAQRKAYVIADNKLALNAGWDLELLSIEMRGLNDAGFDLNLIGFSADEIANLLVEKTDGLTDPDDVPELSDVAVTKAGDVWRLGKHRLMCGDSTVATEVTKLLNEVEPHLMVTDPPYGVEYDANWRNEAARFSEEMGNRKIGAGAVGQVKNDDVVDWSEAWALFSGDVAYVWHAGLHGATVANSLAAHDFVIRSQIIWSKNNFAIGRGDYHWKHEPCFYAVRKNCKGHYVGGRKQTTIWEIDKPQKSETGHSTQKPVECMKRPIENNASPGQAVYEPFSGSGTTIIAGETTGNPIYAMELSPQYVDVAVKRWTAFTGKDAVLEGSGEIFPTIKKDAA
jgi:ParB-like chromosome segregation protein Spo0J